MNLPPFKQIKINSDALARYKEFNKYDDYLQVNDSNYYQGLVNPLITVINGVPIQARMEDAIYFFASKGVGELTQILNNFTLDDIVNGLQKYFGPEYSEMNGDLRANLEGQSLDFNEILDLYEKIRNPSIINSYIYNTLNAFTKTTPSEDTFYVFRCYQRGGPLLDVNGVSIPRIYLNQLTSTSILLRLCDFWCTPSPINFSNTTNPNDYVQGDNSIICIEIPIGSRGISLINYAGIVEGQLTTTYSEFEYLLPPGGYLELTDETYNYTSVTRQLFKINLEQRGLNGTFPHLPIIFDIPIYKYVSGVIPDRRIHISRLEKIYTYVIPKLNTIVIRGMNYVRDQTSRLSSRVSYFLRGNRYVPLGEGRRLRKQTKKQARKYSRKQTKKQSRKQHKKKI